MRTPPGSRCGSSRARADALRRAPARSPTASSMALIREPNKSKAGLILTGGGARAAYQVGVLKAVRELLPLPEKNPFPIVCGTSAGAINAATLAVFAVSITCSGYSSGQSVSFYQGGPDTEAWERTQRVGAAMPIRVEHLIASSALPFIFPAVKINREYFGDGSMRQIAPISPALHLGADRVLVVSTSRPHAHSEPPRVRGNLYPSVAQIAGHALNSIFLDSLNVDIELVQRINRTISLIAPEKLREAGLPLRQIKVLVISPSQPIERMVVRHVRELPWTVRFLLRGIGAMNRNGSNLASYLLFESGYCRALIDLGYQDTMARRAEVLEFLSPRQ